MKFKKTNDKFFGKNAKETCKPCIEDVKLIRLLWSALLQFEIRIDRGDPIIMRMAHEIAGSLYII